MSLLAIQSLLAQLYTDRAFRERFFDDPEGACREVALTDAERRQLTALVRPQVERFARSLKQKRLGLARELLPGTARVTGDRFAELFFQYCDAQPSALDRVEEARAFAGYLLDAARGEAWAPPLPDYLTDLITCERLSLEVLYAAADVGRQRSGVETPVCTYETHLRGFTHASTHTGEAGPNGLGFESHHEAPTPTSESLLDARPQLTARARVAAFRYDMEALYPRVLDGEVADAQPDPCYILIGKVRGAMRARLKRINAATARLLMLCDGTRTLAAIVDEVAAELRLSNVERQAFAAECAAFLGPLIESELIRLSLVKEEDRFVSDAGVGQDHGNKL